jgi:hypothetical protein
MIASFSSAIIAPVAPQVGGAHDLAVEVVADRDVRQPLAQVRARCGEGENGHHLAGRGDDEARFAGQPVRLPAESDDHMTHGAIVYVERARPEDVVHVDAQLVAVVDVRVEHRREQVVRGADGVNVAVEVQVDQLGGQRLGPAAAGRAARQAEHPPERRLAQGHDRVPPDPRETLRKADGSHRLALAMAGGRDGRHENPAGRAARPWCARRRGARGAASPCTCRRTRDTGRESRDVGDLADRLQRLRPS